MAGHHAGLVTTGFGRLQAMQTSIIATCEALGTYSPDQVLANFLDILKAANPLLRLTITVVTPAIMLAAALGQYNLVYNGYLYVKVSIIRRLTASVSISGTHPLNKQVVAWMISRGLGKDARTLTVNSDNNSALDRAEQFALRMGGPHPTIRPADEDENLHAICYLPQVGEYDFVFNGQRMKFVKMAPEDQVTQDEWGRATKYRSKDPETVYIRCFGVFRGVKPIQDFLQHVQDAAQSVEEAATKIFRPTLNPRIPGFSSYQGESTMYFDSGITRPMRKLAAVVMDEHIKQPLIRDIATYLHPNTRKYYIARSIPYRRGYLLYGPPGTGKTSFSCAIAGEFGLSVYLINISKPGLNDDNLEQLFEQLPKRCILLLEDIDCAGIDRVDENEESAPKSKPRGPPPPPSFGEMDHAMAVSPPRRKGKKKRGVTLSGLLNCLDGINAAEGRIAILTSNNPNALDEALVREGRVDQKVLFSHASHEVCLKLFLQIYTKTREEMVDDEVATDHDIPALATQFADAVPPGKLTPAQIQGFLLVHREDPMRALDGAAAWAREAIAVKEKGQNVAAFEGQLKTDQTNVKSDTKANMGKGSKELDDTDFLDDSDISANSSDLSFATSDFDPYPIANMSPNIEGIATAYRKRSGLLEGMKHSSTPSSNSDIYETKDITVNFRKGDDGMMMMLPDAILSHFMQPKGMPTANVNEPPPPMSREESLPDAERRQDEGMRSAIVPLIAG